MLGLKPLLILLFTIGACTANALSDPLALTMASRNFAKTPPTEIYRASQCGQARFSYDFYENFSEFKQAHPTIPVDAQKVSAGLLYISVGQQPHPGYRPQWQVTDQSIQILILAPVTGGFYPMVITNPCLVLAIPEDWPKPVQIKRDALSFQQLAIE